MMYKAPSEFSLQNKFLTGYIAKSFYGLVLQSYPVEDFYSVTYYTVTVLLEYLTDFSIRESQLCK